MLERIRTVFLCFAAAHAVSGCLDSESEFEQPEICSLPFEAGSCDAAIPVYAFVDGKCEPRTYGGCDGNENRFFSLEQCLATCEGRPDPYGCPPDRVRASICIGCGPAGGCGETLEACAKPCSDQADCDDSGLGCFEGVCQLTFCE